MRRLLAYLGRFAVILAGFFCASLGGSGFLHVLILGSMPWTNGDMALAAGGLLLSVPFVALFVGYFALIPAMIVILVAEFLGRRDWLYFSLGGAAAGLAVSFLYRLDRGDVGAPDPITTALALAATGAFAGVCYWLVAGRSSGLTLDGVVSAREP